MDDVRGGFPRRDADGRISRLVDLFGLVLAGLVIGILALALFDAGFALFGAGDFAGGSGWLALIVPAWVFVEEFRAEPAGPARIVAALVAAGLGLAVGLLAAGLSNGMPPLVSGGAGATLAALTYAIVWFHGVRWLARRTG